MKLSEIQPTVDLKNILVSKGIKTPIYANRDRPTTNLPDVFIEIQNNGLARQITSKRGFVTAAVALTINVKLQTIGTANTIKEQNILKQIQDIFDVTVSNGFSNFTLSPNLIAQGLSQTSQYSYIILNFDVTIYTPTT